LDVAKRARRHLPETPGWELTIKLENLIIVIDDFTEFIYFTYIDFALVEEKM